MHFVGASGGSPGPRSGGGAGTLGSGKPSKAVMTVLGPGLNRQVFNVLRGDGNT